MKRSSLSNPLEEIHQKIYDAIKQKRVISFSYDGKEYEVAPHCLFEENGIEQLQGFDPKEDIHLHETQKTFVVSKIASLKSSKLKFATHLGYHFVQKYKTNIYCCVDQPKKWGDQ